jgi:PAS domain S-box-containing protein
VVRSWLAAAVLFAIVALAFAGGISVTYGDWLVAAGVALVAVAVLLAAWLTVRLRGRREQLAALHSVAGEAILHVNRKASVVGASPSAESLYGYPGDELAGRPVADLFADADVAERVAAREPIAGEEATLRRGDESEFAAVVSVAPTRRGAVVVARDVDELRGTQEELRRSETKYRSLTEQLPVATYVLPVDRDAAPLLVGRQIERLTGYTQDEWLREPDLALRLVHSDDRDRVRAAFEQGPPLRTEYRIRARDGRIVWVRDEAVHVLDGEGRPLCIQGFLADISERKTADEDRKQLRVAESTANAEALDRQRKGEFIARSATLLASSLDDRATIKEVAGVAVRELADWCVVDRVDDEGVVTRVVAERAEGHDVGEEPTVDVTEVVKRRRPRLTQREISVPLVAHGGRSLGAITFVAGGRHRPFTSNDLAWAGALAGAVTLAIETARLHDEVEARAEAARVLDYVGDGVFLLDRIGVVRLWNPMAEAITGLAADTVLGRSAIEAIPGWDQLSERVPISHAREPAGVEALPLETEQGERWISISGVRFFGGIVYAFRDITDVHRLDELQAEFVATASHELRTPLAAVYGAAQTLRRHDFALDESGRERFISLIVDESERLGRIVNQILLASQLDIGRLDLITETFDARELLERVAEATRTHLPPHLALRVAAGDSVPPVAADKDRVRQILVNLVENAIKYSPDGGTIELGVESIEGIVLFRVLDEGLGIPADEQPRVFEKFYRLDPDMTRGIGGTGLGLYICSELVERMGGRIWVESREGRGSAFFFELPGSGVPRAQTRARETAA